ncbi:MAG: YccF domain-containing protein [Bacteroidales bacterium]|nr:YccF domain-containing protein [Bacteroidales bacterium]
MNIFGNIAWLILGGILIAFLYFVAGLVLCVTIIGIPFGVQLMKLGAYVLWPFGHELEDGPGQPGCLSVALNLLWILLGWWEIALTHLVCGLLFCITIIGIPLGLMHFRIAIASIFPFGKQIR